MKLSQAIERWLRHLQIERGCSEHTVRAYEGELRRLIEALDDPS